MILGLGLSSPLPPPKRGRPQATDSNAARMVMGLGTGLPHKAGSNPGNLRGRQAHAASDASRSVPLPMTVYNGVVYLSGCQAQYTTSSDSYEDQISQVMDHICFIHRSGSLVSSCCMLFKVSNPNEFANTDQTAMNSIGRI